MKYYVDSPIIIYGMAFIFLLIGYLELDRPTRISALKTRLGFDTIHFEKRLGTQQQAIDYCQDESKRVANTMFYESGTRAVSGKRGDLDDIKDMADSGESTINIASSHFGSYVRYHRGIEKYMTLKSASLNDHRNVEVKIFWGATGTGKTFKASMESERPYWLPNPNGPSALYFDGYDGQDTIIIDDFYGWIPFHVMLRLCDKYHCSLNTKGGTVSLRHKKVIITSNLPPRDWYKNVKDELFAAFTRRITETVHMSEPFVAPPLVNPVEVLRTPGVIRTQTLTNATADKMRTAIAMNGDMFNNLSAKYHSERVYPDPPFKKHKETFIDLSNTGSDDDLDDMDSQEFT